MNSASRLRSSGIALVLVTLLLGLAGCGPAKYNPGSLIFRFKVDPDGTTDGQLPAEAQKVDLALSWFVQEDPGYSKEEYYSALVDNSEKHTEELTYENHYGKFSWTALAYGVHDSKDYLVGAVHGAEFNTASYETWTIEVEYPLRDATLTLQIGEEDPEAVIYCFRIEDAVENFDVSTSPPVDSGESPPAWIFPLPRSSYIWYASSYTDDHPDYPYYQLEDWSQGFSGWVHLDPGENKTIVVDFDLQPVPDPPGEVEAELTAPHADSIVISWPAVPGADSYNLYWSTTPGVTKANGTKLAWVSSGYIHGPLPRGFTYYYVVTAQKGLKESAESQEVSVQIPPG